MLSVLLVLAAAIAAAGAAPAASQAARRPAPSAPFKATIPAAEMANKQAVVDTTAGTFVIDLRPDLAPNHVAYIMKLAGSHAYDGTTFHRVIRGGIIQGGDPISKDPARQALYGTGGPRGAHGEGTRGPLIP